MTILSIQSHLALGRVGDRAAVFALERLGFETWAVPTVLFSNHPGRGSFAGRKLPAAEVAALIGGLEKLGVFATCQAVLSGYLGETAVAPVVAAAVAKIRRANPKVRFVLAPVMGDRDSGLYVEPGLEAAFKTSLVPAADIVVANVFEAERLCGRSITSIDEALAAARAIAALGPKTVVITSVEDSNSLDSTGVVAVGPDGAWRVETPHLPLRAKGAGDAFAALLLGHLLKTDRFDEALGHAVGAIFAVVQATANNPELALLAVQDELERPRRRFSASRL